MIKAFLLTVAIPEPTHILAQQTPRDTPKICVHKSGPLQIVTCAVLVFLFVKKNTVS